MAQKDVISRRGSASVEQTGIVLLVALVLVGLLAWLVGAREHPGHGLGIRIANRIACGPREPGTCRQHPAVSAYGWGIATVVKMLAPDPFSRAGTSGQLVAPVDFRYCQSAGCAIPAGDGRLTTSNRRLTIFTVVSPPSGDAERQITYWLYRPSLGWEKTVRSFGRAEVEAAAGMRVLLEDSPRLVPLEILPGRNHYELPAGDEPPWRWKVRAIHEGWSA